MSNTITPAQTLNLKAVEIAEMLATMAAQAKAESGAYRDENLSSRLDWLVSEVRISCQSIDQVLENAQAKF